MTTGSKIADARKKHNMTQEQLAELLGVTRQSVSRWESDAVYPETEKMIKMAEIFSVDCDYLLREEVRDFSGSGTGGRSGKTLVTRLLQNAVGRKIRLKLDDEDGDLDFPESCECRITSLDGPWAHLELFRGKKIENWMVPVVAILSVTFIKEKE